ncbi:MAG: fatty acid/phospholipid synthesis protein PlsX [Ruminococcaceae bacterium]|nr:fatty acid/phospholipid synthesis protein PlsX [Oscillospiraceae bacterium]
MEIYPFLKSLVDQDTSAVVICDTKHKIVYMNPAACERYAKYGGSGLLGKDLLHCHSPKSAELIRKVLGWFERSPNNNRIHTFYNEKENKDVYMIALRDSENALIGYYEKHEYRDRDPAPLYAFL